MDGVITHAVLLEIDLAGRPARLELTTPDGLLTLHPSADGAQLHGNIVRSGGWGVMPLTLRWDPEREIDVVGRPLAIAAGLHRRRDQTPVGDTIEIDVVAIGAGLEITTTRRRIRREGEGSWRVLPRPGSLGLMIAIDPDGLPANGSSWALESD